MNYFNQRLDYDSVESHLKFQHGTIRVICRIKLFDRSIKPVQLNLLPSLWPRMLVQKLLHTLHHGNFSGQQSLNLSVQLKSQFVIRETFFVVRVNYGLLFFPTFAGVSILGTPFLKFLRAGL